MVRKNYPYKEFKILTIGGGTGNSSHFTVETHASCTKAIELKLGESINYPLLPVTRAIKEKILKMDKEGLLPC